MFSRFDGAARMDLRVVKKNRSGRGRFAKAGFYLLLTAGVLYAQTTPSNLATVECFVTTSDGQIPVSQARIVLTTEDTTGSRAGVSDDQGRFVIRDIPPGRYRVA